MHPNTIKEFRALVNTRGPKMPHMRTRCHTWTGATFEGGYGKFQFQGRSQVASRVAWFFETGTWPDPMALHHCDNPGCVRFIHLFEGDAGLNARDSATKGRRSDIGGRRNPSRRYPERVPRGEAHPFVKFSQTLIDKVRAKYATGRFKQVDLSAWSGISKAQLCMILNRKAWKGPPK